MGEAFKNRVKPPENCEKSTCGDSKWPPSWPTIRHGPATILARVVFLCVHYAVFIINWKLTVGRVIVFNWKWKASQTITLKNANAECTPAIRASNWQVWRKFQRVRDVNISQNPSPICHIPPPPLTSSIQMQCATSCQTSNKMAETCCCRHWLESWSEILELWNAYLNATLNFFIAFYGAGSWASAPLIVENFRTTCLFIAASKDAGHTSSLRHIVTLFLIHSTLRESPPFANRTATSIGGINKACRLSGPAAVHYSAGRVLGASPVASIYTRKNKLKIKDRFFRFRSE